jgi:hypothetical protein
LSGQTLSWFLNDYMTWWEKSWLIK